MRVRIEELHPGGSPTVAGYVTWTPDAGLGFEAGTRPTGWLWDWAEAIRYKGMDYETDMPIARTDEELVAELPRRLRNQEVVAYLEDDGASGGEADDAPRPLEGVRPLTDEELEWLRRQSPHWERPEVRRMLERIQRGQREHDC